MQKTKRFLALFLSLLMLCTVCACKKEAPVTENPAPVVSAPAETGDAEQEIRAFFETFADHFSRGDLPALADLFAKNTPQYETYKSTGISDLIPTDNVGVQLDPQVIETFAKDFLAGCTLSVKSVTASGTAATAILTCRMPDVEAYAKNADVESMLGQFMQEKNYTAESLADKTEEELAAIQNNIMTDFGKWFMQKILASAPYTETNINATLEKTDGKWLITQMDELL